MDILSADNYTKVVSLNTDHAKVHDIDFLQDSSKMITCGEDRKFKVWDTSSWSKTYESEDLGQVVWSCTYASDGFAGVGLNSGEVRLYNPEFSYQTTYYPI